MYDNQPTRPFEGVRKFLIVLRFAARTFATSVEVFLHKPGSFGERYLGLQALAALALIFFWPAFCEPHHDPRPMFIYAGLFFIACVLIRLRTFARQRRGGQQPHSRYNGTPELMKRFRRMDEGKVKRVVEPWVVFLTGAAFLHFSPPLGGYLMLATVGLLISNCFSAEYERRRVTGLNDAYLEQRAIAEGFRDARRD